MAHLSCTAHNRRIFYTDTIINHRNGDGSRCDSPLFHHGGASMTRATLLTGGDWIYPVVEPKPQDPEKKAPKWKIVRKSKAAKR